MNGCIIFFGEAFRLGAQYTRDRGSDQSYDGQMQASKSHISFIKDFNNKNVNIDVYISSYETKFNDDLLKVYKDFLIGHDFYPNILGQEKLIHNAVNKISLEKYNFLLIMRIDLFLKNKFTEIFNHNWNKIMWPSICFKPYHLYNRKHPRVNDVMIFIPKKYYGYIKDLKYSQAGGGHCLWWHLMEHTNLSYDDLNTMLHTFHDSDSAKDFNPLYYIVNRPVSKIHINKNDIFDKYNF